MAPWPAELFRRSNDDRERYEVALDGRSDTVNVKRNNIRSVDVVTAPKNPKERTVEANDAAD